MKEYKSLTELIPEMEPDEIFYKRIFLEYPEAHLDQAHTVEEIEKLCPEASSHAAAGFTYHPGMHLQQGGRDNRLLHVRRRFKERYVR